MPFYTGKAAWPGLGKRGRGRRAGPKREPLGRRCRRTRVRRVERKMPLHRGKQLRGGLGSVAGAGAPVERTPLGGAVGEPAVRRGSAKCLLHGEKQPAGLGKRGGAGAPGREGRCCRRTRRPARGPCFWRGSAEHGAGHAGRGAAAGPDRARPALRLRAWTRRTATRCMRGRRWRSCCGPSGGRRARRPAKHCSPAGDMVH